MGGGVGLRHNQVPSAGDEVLVAYHHRADRGVALGCTAARLLHGDLHVVHAVGPVWKGGMEGEDELLASCYRRSFHLAEASGARSIAFPAISTGAYGSPRERAAAIAVREMTAREDRFERVIACCFSETDAAFYRRLLPAAHLGPRSDLDGHRGP